MDVIKRSGSVEKYNKDKFFNNLVNLSEGLNIEYSVLKKLVNSFKISNKSTTSDLVEYFSNELHEKILDNYDYTSLASRLYITNVYKSSNETFEDYISHFYCIFNEDFLNTYGKYKKEIEEYIDHGLDKNFNYTGLKVLNTYLLKYENKMERPQYLWMRTAIAVNSQTKKNQLRSIKETYYNLSNMFYTHSSPTLFNSGLDSQQLSSCFLLQIEDDSIDGIYSSLKDIAKISQGAGGLGISITNIRNEGSLIKKLSKSNGILGLLKNINATVNYINQSGKRPGSAAVYIEPWHPDIFKFLKAKRFRQNEEFSAKDLFFGLWIPDIFMKRLITGEKWSLFDPSICKDLFELYGREFEKKYIEYETDRKFHSQIDIRNLWSEILDTQIETGGPYILFKDTCNEFSNQNNLGTIKCSNLCTEIIQYTSKDRISVCNLASINLPKMIVEGKFSFDLLIKTTRLIVRNLNQIIDINHYPCEKAKLSNLENRPMGIGVQGLSDLFQELKYSFEDEEAKTLNKNIFETIYFASLDESCEIAKELGQNYKTYENSLIYNGKLHFDFYNMKDYIFLNNFKDLREKIKKYGLYNSLFIAPMPTATTSQIFGNYDCVEPWIYNVYYKKILRGNFKVVNKRLITTLKENNLWKKDTSKLLLNNRGSIQSIYGIPYKIKKIFKTVFEIDNDILLQYYIDRAPFIDQNQSMNIYIKQEEEDKYNEINKLIFKAWRNKLKSGVYYLRIEESNSSSPKCESCSS